MSCTVESTEALEKEFSKNHKDKKERFQRMVENWNRHRNQESLCEAIFMGCGNSE